MGPKTKVCCVVTKGVWGGAQRYVFDLANGLTGEEFAVLVASGPGPLGEKLAAAGLRHELLPRAERDLNLLADLRTFFDLLRLFKRERPDIIHLNSAKAGGLGALAARVVYLFSFLKPKTYHLKPCLVFTNHGWAFNENRPAWQKWLIKFFHWLTILAVDEVINVSEFERLQVAHWPLSRKKLRLIYNGLAAPDFLYREPARAALAAGESRLLATVNQSSWVGTIAELHPNKDLGLALRAIAQTAERHPEVKFLIIGEGEERQKLSAEIQARGLTGRVFLLGRRLEAARYLKAFDIFLLTSNKEGLPYAILEAGLAELPVVATRVGAVAEIIADGKTGLLVPAGNADETSAALNRLFANGLEREILGRNLRGAVTERFALERMIAETAALYRELLAKSNRQTHS